MSVRHGLILLTLLSVTPVLRGAETPDGTAIVDFFGYTGCLRLENSSTRVVLCHQAGGRVLEYSLHGVNVIYLDPAGAGWTTTTGGRSNMTGGRFDIGPEQVNPPRPVLWEGAWTPEITGPRAARLTSQHDPATGVQLVRDFRLSETSSRLDITQTIRNVSDQTCEYCHWSRTFALGGGIAIVPLTPPSRFPNFYTMRQGRDEILIRPVDEHIRVRDGFLEILAPPAHPKLGIESYAGWFAYLMPNDLAFLKRFPAYRDRSHSEVDGHNVSIWYPQAGPMIELEPLGPRERLAPGDSASFTESWELRSFPFPAAGAAVDLKQLDAIGRETATTR
jgi:hypothetical protein